jgi:hypothetical protein
VIKKKPENQLNKRDIIPQIIEGIHTDVVETGELHVNREAIF